MVEAEQLYEKILENITNKVVKSLGDNISYQSAFAQKESSEQKIDDLQTSSAYFCTKEESTSYNPENKEIKRNSYKEPPNISASIEMIPYPYRGQAWHPNFDSSFR